MCHHKPLSPPPPSSSALALNICTVRAKEAFNLVCQILHANIRASEGLCQFLEGEGAVCPPRQHQAAVSIGLGVLAEEIHVISCEQAELGADQCPVIRVYAQLASPFDELLCRNLQREGGREGRGGGREGREGRGGGREGRMNTRPVFLY